MGNLPPFMVRLHYLVLCSAYFKKKRILEKRFLYHQEFWTSTPVRTCKLGTVRVDDGVSRSLLLSLSLCAATMHKKKQPLQTNKQQQKNAHGRISTVHIPCTSQENELWTPPPTNTSVHEMGASTKRQRGSALPQVLAMRRHSASSSSQPMVILSFAQGRLMSKVRGTKKLSVKRWRTRKK